MAQPQHVRNDPHLDRFSLLGLNPLYAPSHYEYHVRDHPAPSTGYAPVYRKRSSIDVLDDVDHSGV